jgi:AraC family transcriptional regulator of adaptative response / DNA-3-methyladenine glycosylase II
MAEVAFGAGFASLRSFNATVAEVFALSPTELRRRAAPRTRALPRAGDGAGVAAGAGGAGGAAGVDRPWHHVALRLPFRAPLTADGLFGHLVATRVPGVEEWREGAFRRTLSLPHGPGIVALTPAGAHVGARLWLTDLRDLAAAVNRCRELLDLDADPVAVDEQLASDERLSALVAAAPGRRVPRTVDAEELAVRVVLGQQVSTAAAQTLAARLVQAHGAPVADPAGALTHVFPSPETLAAADLGATGGMPVSRRRTLSALSAALAGGAVRLGAGEDWAQARAGLAAIPGVGPWTVEMVAMRGLGDPDAFPASDLGVRGGLRDLGLAPAADLADARARWRPWGAYAVQHLWATRDHPANRLPRDPAA